jgi:hypothetical protein
LHASSTKISGQAAGAVLSLLACVLAVAVAATPASDLSQFRVLLAPPLSEIRDSRITVANGQLVHIEDRRPAAAEILVRVKASGDAVVKFESTKGSFEFRSKEAAWGVTLERQDGQALIARVPIEEKLSEAAWVDDHPVIAIGKDGRRWVSWIAYQDGSDAVAVSDGAQVRRVTDRGDHHGPAITIDARGWIRVAWAEREGQEYHIYESVYVAERWSRALRLTQSGTSNIAPVLVSGGSGRMALVWQSLRNGQSVVMLRLSEERGWSAEQQISVGGGNAWVPAAAWGGEKLWIAWDAYAAGSHQIYTRSVEGLTPGRVQRITVSEGYAVRPSIAATPGGVPIVAWEESDANWGKDFPFLSNRDASEIDGGRRIRAAFLEAGQFRELPLPAESLTGELRRFLQQPRLALDSSGRLYLAFRARTEERRWQSFLTQLADDRWLSAIAMPMSAGGNTLRSAIAASGEAIHVAWASGDQDVYAAAVPSSGVPASVPMSPAGGQ